MDKIIAKLEGVVDNLIKKFEEEPLKTSAKALVVLFIVKKVYGWVKA